MTFRGWICTLGATALAVGAAMITDAHAAQRKPISEKRKQTLTRQYDKTQATLASIQDKLWTLNHNGAYNTPEAHALNAAKRAEEQRIGELKLLLSGKRLSAQRPVRKVSFDLLTPREKKQVATYHLLLTKQKENARTAAELSKWQAMPNNFLNDGGLSFSLSHKVSTIVTLKEVDQKEMAEIGKLEQKTRRMPKYLVKLAQETFK